MVMVVSLKARSGMGLRMTKTIMFSFVFKRSPFEQGAF